jgi:class 3 adenylate cyclase
VGKKIVTTQIDKFMKGVRSAPKDHIPTDYSNGDDDKPIADLFLDTSIMFADIVGFTNWSTQRSPNEVFRLLERLFWEFDELAAMHNVFKLGTIGDCYIAVTGIPNPVIDHASVLTKFAFAARDKVHEVCTQLDAEGLNTLNLDMRFGIHSGAITAGILRGTKSRFELFGDTINTASRMESTSVGGKIQVSAETAELIRLDRREAWLVKRDGMVTAKGKGQLQTYWVEPNSRGESRVSFSDEFIDHLVPGCNLNSPDELKSSERYYQHEYEKREEEEGLVADEKV